MVAIIDGPTEWIDVHFTQQFEASVCPRSTARSRVSTYEPPWFVANWQTPSLLLLDIRTVVIPTEASLSVTRISFSSSFENESPVAQSPPPLFLVTVMVPVKVAATDIAVADGVYVYVLDPDFLAIVILGPVSTAVVHLIHAVSLLESPAENDTSKVSV